MTAAAEYSAALEAAIGMLQSDLENVERWRIADLFLTVARLQWRQKRLLSSFLSAVRAVMARMSWVVGGTLKQLLRRLGLVQP